MAIRVIAVAITQCEQALRQHATSCKISLPFVGIIYGKQWFDDNDALCKTIGFICTVSCLVSMLNIVMISINRYIHICLDSRVRKNEHQKKTYLFILVCTSADIMTSLGNVTVMSNLLGLI